MIVKNISSVFSDIYEAHSKGQMCSLIGVEGGHSLANSLSVLRILYSLGVRYLTLTSTCNTQWLVISIWYVVMNLYSIIKGYFQEFLKSILWMLSRK